jgi:cytoskeletal protein RodZ
MPVSDQLRRAREAQNLTIHQVADVTKIRTDHIRALEEGNYDIFSAPVYIKGFVRSYATLLKLDVPPLMAELEEELAQTTKHSEPPPLSDTGHGLMDFITLQLSNLDLKKGAIGAAVLGSIVLIVVIGAIWRHHVKTDPLSGLKPGVYHSTQHVSGETLPLPHK